jgi:hypothetical protein
MVMRLKVAISGPASVNAGGTLEKELAYGLPKLLVSWKFQGSIHHRIHDQYSPNSEKKRANSLMFLLSSDRLKSHDLPSLNTPFVL